MKKPRKPKAVNYEIIPPMDVGKRQAPEIRGTELREVMEPKVDRITILAFLIAAVAGFILFVDMYR